MTASSSSSSPEPTGGRTTRPTRSSVGSSSVSIVSIPDFALFSFVQLGSFAPLQVSHIEPVRSKTMTMSAGRSAHGPHAVDRTWIEILLTPKSRRKNVLAFPDSSTTTALSGAQPGSDATHFSDTTCWTPVMPPLVIGVLAARPGAVLRRGTRRDLQVRQLRRAGERGRVGRACSVRCE